MIPAWYLHLVDVLVFCIAFTQTVFVAVYSRAPWWQTPIGRALMLKGLALAAIFDIAAATRVFGEVYPGRFVVGAAVFTLVAVGSAYQTLVVVRTQWHTRRDSSSDDPLAARDPHNVEG